MFLQWGYPWFIAIFTKFVVIKGKTYQQNYNYVCVIDGDKTKNSSMVIALLDAVIYEFKKAHPEVTSLEAKSDNGNYNLLLSK